MTDLYDLSLAQLESFVTELGEKPFRAKQIYRQLYVTLSTQFREMTDLSEGLRSKLDETAAIGSLKRLRVMEGDNGLTRKALFEVKPGIVIETVLMVYDDRATVCVSSQAGCPMGCTFCATAKLGFLEDMTPGQIVEQVLWAARELKQMREDNPPRPTGTPPKGGTCSNSPPPEGYAQRGVGPGPDKLTNIVFMGMGEPFNNYDNWWSAVEHIHDPKGFDMGARRLTVSTVGLVPGILKLAEEELPINLAISLHSADDDVRSGMMPVNKRYPIQELLEATRTYLDKTGRRVSFEYVLLQEENDTPELAELLAKRLTTGPLADMRTLFHVNLIPWNPVPGNALKRSQRDRVLAFQSILKSHHVPCTVRVERGVDIGAACGQLAGTDESASA